MAEPSNWTPPRYKMPPGFRFFPNPQDGSMAIQVPRDWYLYGPTAEQRGRELRAVYLRARSYSRWCHRKFLQALAGEAFPEFFGKG